MANAHATLKAYDKAFAGLVRLYRRYDIPAWPNLAAYEAVAHVMGVGPSGMTWHTYLASKGKNVPDRLRAYLYIIQETVGDVPWWHAASVPISAQDKRSDPQVDKPAGHRLTLPGYEPPPAKPARTVRKRKRAVKRRKRNGA